MKSIIYLLTALLPVLTFAQPVTNPSSLSASDWQPVGPPGFSARLSACLSLAINPVTGEPYVAYMDCIEGSQNEGPATVMRFDGTSWVPVGPVGFTIDHVGWTDLAFDTLGIPYVVYSSACTYPYRVTVMRFMNDTWSNVGNSGLFGNDASQTSIAFSPGGEPHVAYLDHAFGDQASVMKFDGNNWGYVGSPQFTPGDAWKEEIAFSPSGVPYVAFWNYPALTASVMSFNGNTWEAVGTPECTGVNTNFQSLAVSPVNGFPYLAFIDSTHSNKVSVIMYDGNDWVPVGEMGFSGMYASDVTMTINSIGEPFVFYWEGSLSYSVVQKFDGADWIPVGSLNFTGGYVFDTEMAFGPSGELYVAYQDYHNGDRASVMKYEFTTGIGEKTGNPLSIYPNPVKSVLNIDLLKAGPGEKEINIFNLQGQLKLVGHASGNTASINVEDLPAGTYILRVIGECSVFVSKFVRN